MKLPRDVHGSELVKALRVLGYAVSRQSGSHIIVTTLRDGEYHETIPNHRPMRIGTLANILKNIAVHHGMTMEAVRDLLEL